jgi:hypothetical protein
MAIAPACGAQAFFAGWFFVATPAHFDVLCHMVIERGE